MSDINIFDVNEGLNNDVDGGCILTVNITNKSI